MKDIETGQRACLLAAVLHRLACAAVVGAPWAAWASTDSAANTVSTGPDLSGVGRALGMMLFAYLALKWFNLRRDRNEIDVRVVTGNADVGVRCCVGAHGRDVCTARPDTSGHPGGTHSGSMPAALITRPHLSVSDAWNRASSSGVVGKAWPPLEV